jgi:hypothetical protein
MFKILLGILDSARKAFDSEDGQVRQGLAGLAHLSASLAARASTYVVDGSEVSVLVELPAHAAQASPLLGKPGGLRWRHGLHQVQEELRPRVQAGIAARNALYRRVGATPEDAALLARLGRVLEAADGGQSLDRAGSAAPDWLQYVLNDALWSSLPHEDAKNRQNNLVELLPAWDIRMLRALLADADLPQQMALSIVFERRGIDAYYHDQIYRRLLAAGPLDDDMLSHPDEVEFVAGALSAPGRTVLANRIGTSSTLRNTFAALLARLAVGDSKTVRAAAARHLDALDRAVCLAHLERLLRDGQGEERANAAELLARVQGAAAGPVLEVALARETSKPVQQAIRAALTRIQAASDAADVELPAPPPLPEEEDTVLANDALDLLLSNREQLLERLRQATERETQDSNASKHKFDFQRKHYASYRQLDAAQLREALRALNGSLETRHALGNRSVIETLTFGGRLEARSDFGLMQALRLQAGAAQRQDWLWDAPHFAAWRRRQDPSRLDLRQLSKAAERCGYPPDVLAHACLRNTWGVPGHPQYVLPPERVWPCLAQFPELIDEGLGMAHVDRARYQGLDLGHTLTALDTFPIVPSRWLPRVMELALGEAKTHRHTAQRILGKLPDIGKRVLDALQSSKQELRVEAARWLARMDYRPAVPALYAALDKESREPVSAALLTALEAQGEDIAPRLAPDVLLKQARKGLKAKPPAALAWLNLDLLPACAWLDGTPVEPDIIRWWVVLAAKLKEPAANALLVRYLGLLDRASSAALGRFLLHQFIGRDTGHPPLEEAIAWATREAPGRYQNNQQLAQRYPQYYADQGALTEDQVFEQVKREKLSEYLGSAIGEKGILALVCCTPGHELVDALRAYMRDHYMRRAQIEAMLEAAGVSDDPPVIQFILATARRYRTASVQQKARMLVERIAERNGWTEDQLADRTVPTGGFDETGRMTFQYGARDFSVLLDDKLKPVLHNPDGKPITALPAARQNDPAESIKEGKQLFAACRKEVKQVVDLQTARLYEAMCAGRVWPAADWDEYLRRHPLVGRLAQRLAWTRVDDEGAVIGVFRPTEDGSLIDVDDEEVELPSGARIALAHASQFDEATVKAWLAHFKDYKVAPLFAQLTRRLPVLPDPAAIAIDDRLGWTSDAFTLRGAFAKLGYQRAPAEDGGVFMEYTKDFASAGLQVRIEFSGNALPEQNLPAALKTLSFSRLGASRGYGASRNVSLSTVPRVLLAEAYGDYHAAAASCAGFDPEWQSKMPW